jgi:hypothetical protein
MAHKPDIFILDTVENLIPHPISLLLSPPPPHRHSWFYSPVWALASTSSSLISLYGIRQDSLDERSASRKASTYTVQHSVQRPRTSIHALREIRNRDPVHERSRTTPQTVRRLDRFWPYFTLTYFYVFTFYFFILKYFRSFHTSALHLVNETVSHSCQKTHPSSFYSAILSLWSMQINTTGSAIYVHDLNEVLLRAESN